MAFTVKDALFNNRIKVKYGTQGYVPNNIGNYTGKILKRRKSWNNVFYHIEGVVILETYNSFDHVSRVDYQYFIEKYFKETHLMSLEINKGRTFGTLELDRMLHRKFFKGPPTQVQVKSSNDVLCREPILSYELKNDGYNYIHYLPSFSYESVTQNDYSYEQFIDSQNYLPQTNFYILEYGEADKFTESIRHLYSDEQFNDVWNWVRETNRNAWDYDGYAYKFDNETILKRAASHSFFTPVCMLTEDEYYKLKNLVLEYRIGDPSHKNIYFTRLGIMHLGTTKQFFSI